MATQRHSLHKQPLEVTLARKQVRCCLHKYVELFINSNFCCLDSIYSVNLCNSNVLDMLKIQLILMAQLFTLFLKLIKLLIRSYSTDVDLGCLQTKVTVDTCSVYYIACYIECLHLSHS